jgi:hypothetical protein
MPHSWATDRDRGIGGRIDAAGDGRIDLAQGDLVVAAVLEDRAGRDLAEHLSLQVERAD